MCKGIFGEVWAEQVVPVVGRMRLRVDAGLHGARNSSAVAVCSSTQSCKTKKKKKKTTHQHHVHESRRSDGADDIMSSSSSAAEEEEEGGGCGEGGGGGGGGGEDEDDDEEDESGGEDIAHLHHHHHQHHNNHHHHHIQHHQQHHHQQQQQRPSYAPLPLTLRQQRAAPPSRLSCNTSLATAGTGWLSVSVSVGGRVRRTPGRPRPPTALLANNPAVAPANPAAPATASTTSTTANTGNTTTTATSLPLLSLAQLQHLQQPNIGLGLGTLTGGVGGVGAACAAGFYKMVQCAGCDRPILDRFLLNVLDRAWHAKCVQCTDCKCNLTEKCFSREGKIYCRADFFRRFGTKCAGCSQGISPSDLVRRARSKVFHLKCFTCMVCRKQLSTGEELYVLDENKFICKQDYLNTKTAQGASACSETADDGEDVDVKPDVNIASSGTVVAVMAASGDPACGGHGVGAAVPTGAGPPGSGPPNSASAATGGAVGGGHGHHAHHPSSGGTGTGSGGGADSSAASQTSSTADKESRDSGGSVDGDRENREHENSVPDENAIGAKRRGPRTTIKAKQLETLKSAFAATPKPTRHIREQLAQETGLNMRVIQVWFQNRRSKERRMKQLSSMGSRRHFFRNPRRMRALRPGMSPDGLDDSPEMVPNSGFGYFSDQRNCCAANQRAPASLSFADNSSQGEFAYGGQTFFDFFPGQTTPHASHGPQGAEALTFPMVGAQSPAVPGQANTMDGPMGTGNVNLGADAPYLPHGDILSQRSSPDSVLNLPAVGVGVGGDSFAGPPRSTSDVFPALGHSHGHGHGHGGHTHTPMTETSVW